MMRITLLSDSHNKHHEITNDLPGGDLLIHAGDFMNSGYSQYEAEDFFKWFDKINNYDTKVLIAGNHDRLMQDRSDEAQDILTGYKTIEYLQDEDLVLYYDGHNGDRPEDNIRIYGSPWQPYFHNWAFNLQRGEQIQKKWDLNTLELNISEKVAKEIEHLRNDHSSLIKISSSQWGGIRAYAAKHKTHTELENKLFGNKDTKEEGYLTHGVAEEKYWGKNGNLRKFKEIFDKNKEFAKTAFVEKFAAEMAKENKRFERKKNGN